MNTRVELAGCGTALLRDRINREAHMLAGVAIVDPASTWIEPGVTLEPDTTVEPFHHPARSHVGSVVVPSSARTPSSPTPRSAPEQWSARSVTFDQAPCSRHPRRRARSSRSRTRASAAKSKVPHLSYIGDADVGEGTNIGAGNITANYDGRLPKQPDDDRAQRAGPARTAFVAPWRSATTHDGGRLGHHRRHPRRRARHRPRPPGNMEARCESGTERRAPGRAAAVQHRARGGGRA